MESGYWETSSFKAPSNIEDEHCDLCGQKILPGEMIIEGERLYVVTMVHEACLEALQQDLQEEGAA